MFTILNPQLPLYPTSRFIYLLFVTFLMNENTIDINRKKYKVNHLRGIICGVEKYLYG